MPVDIMFVVCTSAIFIVFFIQLTKMVRLRLVHHTLRKAIEAGQPLSDDLIDRLDAPTPAGHGDERAGYVLVALGIATLLAALIGGASVDNGRAMAAIAVFPILVGAALLFRLRRARARDQA